MSDTAPPEPEPLPDIGAMPKFDVLTGWLGEQQQTGATVPAMLPKLHTWLEKLKAWCFHSINERKRLESRVEELRERADAQEQTLVEMREVEEILDEGIGKILDFERGLCDPAELVAWAKDNKNKEASAK